MKILGLNSGEINSSAALIVDGVVKVGLPEERCNRQKKTKSFPKFSIQYILNENKLNLDDLDFVCQAWNPGAGLIKYNPLISSNRIKREDYFYSIPDGLFNFKERNPSDWIKMEFGNALPPIYYIQHHRCHAANAFFLSEYENAAILTADWRGEFECLTRSVGKSNKIEFLDAQTIPDSLGMFYATFTELLGYQSDNDEWKVMALSAYQEDCSDFVEKIRKTIRLLPDGKFQLDQKYYKGALLDQPNLYTKELFQLMGSRKGYGSKDTDLWMIQIAKAMQFIAEETAIHVIDDLYEKTNQENLVLAGGFFMNSVLNGKITQKTKFKNVYISYAPDDVGNSIGAAMYLNHCILGQPRVFLKNTSSIGPSFSEEYILSAINRRKIKFIKMQNPAKKVAELLFAGNVIGFFQGRMEFGDRALGNRSIIADPRKSDMKDKINNMIKYREGYRPFAPAVVFEESSKYFEVPKNYECNYMEKVVLVRKEYRDHLQAVTHFDGSGRLQTVIKSQNEYFYNVISEFGRLAEIPCVLNTSFNVNGEPIVLSPDDAIGTFYNSGLDYLVLEDFLISK